MVLVYHELTPVLSCFARSTAGGLRGISACMRTKLQCHSYQGEEGGEPVRVEGFVFVEGSTVMVLNLAPGHPG